MLPGVPLDIRTLRITRWENIDSRFNFRIQEKQWEREHTIRGSFHSWFSSNLLVAADCSQMRPERKWMRPCTAENKHSFWFMGACAAKLEWKAQQTHRVCALGSAAAGWVVDWVRTGPDRRRSCSRAVCCPSSSVWCKEEGSLAVQNFQSSVHSGHLLWLVVPFEQRACELLFVLFLG